MITVVAVTGIKAQETYEAVEQTQRTIPHQTRKHIILQPGMTLDDYSRFIVKELNKEIQTEFALVCQWDGFGRNVELWDDAFLEYDYVGAPWFQGETGNGGLSLRSKRFLEASAALPDPFCAEDAYLCQYKRKELESLGLKFAPIDVALRFSFEHPVDGIPWNRHDSWGMHGAHNL